jgi:hypothetical protein
MNPGEELVVLCHHPLDWLQDSTDARRYVENRARVFICGHEHRPSFNVQTIGKGCDLMTLFAGAAVPPNEDDGYTFAYNILQFDWHADSEALCVTVRPRAWLDGAKHFDSDPIALGKEVVIRTLGCPNFRRGPNRSQKDAMCHPEIEPGSTETHPAENGPDDPIIEKGGKQVSDGYPILLLRFFRDLSGSQRLAVLLNLGALPHDWQEPLTHSVERYALDSLKRSGRMDALEKAIKDAMQENREDGDGHKC